MAALSTTTLGHYTRFARRYAVLLVSCMCGGLLAGLGWALLQPPSYSATASVILSPVPSYVSVATSGRLPRQVTIDSDAQLVRDPTVLGAVAMAVGGDADDVEERIRVTAAPLTQVLLITFTTDSPAEAAAGATAAANSFIGVRQESLGALQEDQIGRLEYRMTELQARLDSQGEQSPVVLSDDPLVSQIAELSQRYADLERIRTSSAEVSRTATPPSAPDPTNDEVPLTSGVMGGLLAGCVIGAARDMVRARQR